jgi:glycosyltransferase involved in cell wall biosynthesis
MENNKPLVSVVLATYNGEQFIRPQLESLLSQTYSPLEIIVVDDCSTDNTRTILNEYAERFHIVKVFSNQSNLGYIKNFENGCKLSTGAFISFCDQDDFWEKDKITLSMERIGLYSMIHCDSAICNYSLEFTGELISDRVRYAPINNCLKLAVFNRINGHSMLFTREIAEQAYPFLEIIPHDWWLCYVASLNNGINYLNIPLVKYRQHNNNLFGVVGRRENTDKALQKYEYSKKNEQTKIRNRIKIFYEKCPAHFEKEKKVLKRLLNSYQSFSVSDNFARMILFFQYGKVLLSVKKRSSLRNFFYCMKMFATIK